MEKRKEIQKEPLNESVYEDCGYGITCIDTGLFRPRLAACYMIEEAGEAAFVDTGTGHTVPRLLALLAERQIPVENVRWVMPTHVHLDHAGGVGALMQQLPNAQLLIHPRGAPHMIDPQRLQQGTEQVYGTARYQEVFGDLVPVDKARVREIADGESVILNGRSLTFLHTEGHARHHYCIFDEGSSGLFTGDTFGASYPPLNTETQRFVFPPTTPIQFDPDAWHDSLERLMSWHPQRVFLTHYGIHEAPADMAAQLHGAIDHYVELALAYEHAADKPMRLEDALMGTSVRQLQEMGCKLDSRKIQALLEGDMGLNAQGLAHWLSVR